MVTKSVARRNLHALAGKRFALPGHPASREEKLRCEFADHFDPQGPVEMMWVADIAHCCAVIEVIRAQIAAVRVQQIKDTLAALFAYPDLRIEDEEVDGEAQFLEMYRPDFDAMRHAGFVAEAGTSLLDDPVFANLLGRISPQQAMQITLLQGSLHEEMRERDRLVRQIDRTRREVMRHAVDMAEAQHRAQCAGYVIAGLGAYLEAQAGDGTSRIPGDSDAGNERDSEAGDVPTENAPMENALAATMLTVDGDVGDAETADACTSDAQVADALTGDIETGDVLAEEHA
jgi:hypothetical protein